jgi:hypothetical protein
MIGDIITINPEIDKYEWNNKELDNNQYYTILGIKELYDKGYFLICDGVEYKFKTVLENKFYEHDIHFEL